MNPHEKILQLRWHAQSCFMKWATTWQNQQNVCAPSEDSDQPGHPPSLITVFAVRMKKTWVLTYPLSAQRRLDQTGRKPRLISLRWVHSFCWFCHVVAQIYHITELVTFLLDHINTNLMNQYVHCEQLENEPPDDKTQQNDLCAQRTLRSAWASAQSDQSSLCAQ